MKRPAATYPGRVTLAATLLLFLPYVVVAFAQTAGTAPAGTPAVPINITASQGIEWLQAQQEVIATGDAKAVRGAVTVTADQLTAHYRKKAVPPGQNTAAAAPAGAAPASAAPAAAAPAANDPEAALDNGDTEIYQLDAAGHVHIFTATDNAYGDHAVYSMDNAVLVLTGIHLKLTTPTEIITARDSIEYYSVKRMAVARGNALLVANNGRSIAADTLIGYLAPAPTASSPVPANAANPPDMLAQGGKLQKVDAIGHVIIRTPSETATGNRGVYLPEQGLSRLGGDVHIIRGPNQLNGADALFNTKTGVATLLAGPSGQVSGIVVPNSAPPQ
jgi:lipopolysaccharide export system protein LptA